MPPKREVQVGEETWKALPNWGIYPMMLWWKNKKIWGGEGQDNWDQLSSGFEMFYITIFSHGTRMLTASIFEVAWNQQLDNVNFIFFMYNAVSLQQVGETFGEDGPACNTEPNHPPKNGDVYPRVISSICLRMVFLGYVHGDKSFDPFPHAVAKYGMFPPQEETPKKVVFTTRKWILQKCVILQNGQLNGENIRENAGLKQFWGDRSKKTLRYPHHPPFVPWSRVRFHRDFDLHVGGPRKSTMSVMSVMAVRKKEVSYGRYPRHNAGDSPFSI